MKRRASTPSWCTGTGSWRGLKRVLKWRGQRTSGYIKPQDSMCPRSAAVRYEHLTPSAAHPPLAEHYRSVNPCPCQSILRSQTMRPRYWACRGVLLNLPRRVSSLSRLTTPTVGIGTTRCPTMYGKNRCQADSRTSVAPPLSGRTTLNYGTVVMNRDEKPTSLSVTYVRWRFRNSRRHDRFTVSIVLLSSSRRPTYSTTTIHSLICWHGALLTTSNHHCCSTAMTGGRLISRAAASVARTSPPSSRRHRERLQRSRRQRRRPRHLPTTCPVCSCRRCTTTFNNSSWTSYRYMCKTLPTLLAAIIRRLVYDKSICSMKLTFLIVSFDNYWHHYTVLFTDGKCHRSYFWIYQNISILLLLLNKYWLRWHSHVKDIVRDIRRLRHLKNIFTNCTSP